MNDTPRRKGREKLFKAFYCFSASDSENGAVRTVSKYKPPISFSARQETASPTVAEPEQVQDTAVALLCLPDGLQRAHQLNKDDSLPSEQFHTFVITQETGHRLFGSALQVWEHIQCPTHPNVPSKNGAIKVQPEHQDKCHVETKCYQSKALCLLTSQPLLHASKRILQYIWAHNCSIELIQLICSVPTPGENRFLRMRLPQLNRRLSASNASSAIDPTHKTTAEPFELLMYGGLATLPSFDYPLRYLFTQLLPPNQFFRLFTALLLEQRILITSSRHLPLMLVAESLTCLLRPFSWQHVYVPILPSRLGLHYLDAPTPYIMGVVLQPQNDSTKSDSSNLPESPSPTTSAHWRLDCDRKTLYLQPQTPSEIDSLLASIDHPDSATSLSSTSQDYNSMDAVPVPPSDPADEEVPPFLVELQTLLDRLIKEWKAVCRCLPDAQTLWNSLEGDQIKFPTTNKSRQMNGHTNSIDSSAHKNSSPDSVHYLEEQRFNHLIRSLVYRHLQRNLLHNHERFIQFTRPDTVKFDAVSFLCDQPAANRPFLVRFLQTQMFASYLDESGRKLQTQLNQQTLHHNSARDAFCIVDTDDLMDEQSLPPTDTSHLTTAFNDAKLLDLRTLADPNLSNINNIHSCTNSIPNGSTPNGSTSNGRGNKYSHGSGRLANSSPFKVCMSPIRSKPLKQMRSESNSIQAPAEAFAAQTHFRVVDSLLKEAKVKTKRIVLDCMRDEQRSSNEVSLSVIQEEQNTQVAALCDLIQRIWSHGRSGEISQARCSFWFHLTTYVNSLNTAQAVYTTGNATKSTQKLTNDSKDNLTAIGWMKKQFDFSNSNGSNRSSLSPLSSPIRALLRPSAVQMNGASIDSTDYKNSRPPSEPPATLQYDFSSIQSLSDISTDIGRSRAFIRLCLQRRLLSSHLRTLLSDRVLLFRFYRKHAFLRAEEEREQFLTYLLTLSTVRLRSFSALYGNCSLKHRLYVHGSGGFAGQLQILLQPPTSPITLSFATPARTQHIFYARQLVQPIFVWMRVSGQIRFFLNQAFLINEVTGDAFRLKCNRWFGKSIEDGATERLLMIKPIQPQNIAELVHKTDASRGYSIGRHWNRLFETEDVPTSDQLADWLGRAVNLLCRTCLPAADSNAAESTWDLTMSESLLDLLFGERQTLFTFSAVLHDGFRCRSSRYSFRPSEHVWDLLVRIQTDLASETHQDKKTNFLQKLIKRIIEQANSLGKEDRMRLLILLCIRDRFLITLFEKLLQSRLLSTYYEGNAFLRQPSTAYFLNQVLSPLIDIRLQLPSELTKGI